MCFFYTSPLVGSPVFVLAIYVVWPREPVSLCTTKVASSPDVPAFFGCPKRAGKSGDEYTTKARVHVIYNMCMYSVQSGVNSTNIVCLYTTIVTQHGMGIVKL